MLHAQRAKKSQSIRSNITPSSRLADFAKKGPALAFFGRNRASMDTGSFVSAQLHELVRYSIAARGLNCGHLGKSVALKSIKGENQSISRSGRC